MTKVGQASPASSLDEDFSHGNTETLPPLSAVGDASLRNDFGETSIARQLWANQPVLILCLRRPGCIMCRAEARKLFGLKPTLDSLGVRMVCIVHEWLPAEAAAFKPAYWGGELYLDEEKQLFKALGGGQLRKGSHLTLLNPRSSVWKNVKEAKTVVDDHNFKGSGLILGGLFVMRPGEGGVEYMFVEQNFGDHASQDAVIEACRRATAYKAHPTR
ncbi:hypothetical protein WJX72_008085 [[Myrmecia] bisecta]|uniref:Peroxiredoxin-like 2A n=1 Tax=[Myrmecia] bisecta TaxID=41462 RepID=A0AAW1Q873_9CHLO